MATTTEHATTAGQPPARETGDETALLRLENAQLRALLALQGDLGQGTTPGEILQQVVEQVHDAMGCDRCYALLWDSAHQTFRPAAVSGLTDPMVAALKRLDLARRDIPILDRAFASDSYLAIEDASTSALVPATLANELDLGAILLAPLRRPTHEPVGVLLFDFTLDRTRLEPSPLTPARRQLAGAVAGQLALLIENANLYDQLRRRSRHLEALTEIGLGLAAHASDEPGVILQRLYPRLAEVVDSAGCHLALGAERQRTITVWSAYGEPACPEGVILPLGNDLLSCELRSRQPTLYRTPDDIATAGGLPTTIAADGHDRPGAAVCLPLRLRRRTFGVLLVTSARPAAFTDEQVEFLATIAAQAAVTLEHGRLYDVVRAKGEVRRRLLDQALQAQEVERKNLVDSILDDALQELASCTYRLDFCVRLSEMERHDQAREELRATRQQLAAQMESLRAFVGSLRPTTLDRLGLQSVLRDELVTFGQQCGIQTEFVAGFKDRLAPAVENRAYRIVQELLSNIQRHASARSVTVELQQQGAQVTISVIDDGQGFDTGEVLRDHGGMGLHAIREQAEVLGGTVQVYSRPRAGTRVEVILPREIPGQGEGGL